jgi:preprotein translocase subunit SecG
MTTVLLVIHVIIAIALVGVILMQKSEGGALGIGGGGGFMSARGQGNALTKATAILATIFLLTSIGLTVLQSVNRNGSSIMDEIEKQEAAPKPAPAGEGGADKGTNTGTQTPAVPLSD